MNALLTPLHIIKESVSPTSAPVWTMWCGATCVALDDGDLLPPLDFFAENAADKATCSKCLAAVRVGERVEEVASAR